MDKGFIIFCSIVYNICVIFVKNLAGGVCICLGYENSYFLFFCSIKFKCYFFFVGFWGYNFILVNLCFVCFSVFLGWNN